VNVQIFPGIRVSPQSLLIRDMEVIEVPLKMLLTKGWMIIPEFSTGYILIPSVN